jgi:hypothetical protein
MATTSFHMVIGARLRFASIAENRTATFKLSAGPLMRFDPYGSAGFTRNARATGKPWLPPKHVKPIDPRTGDWTDEWRRFWEYAFNERLGGINGPSMGEVQANVVETKAAAVQAVVASAAVETVVIANAEALAATVQVAQSSSLDGADQIPEVLVRTSYKRDTFY